MNQKLCMIFYCSGLIPKLSKKFSSITLKAHFLPFLFLRYSKESCQISSLKSRNKVKIYAFTLLALL